MWRTDFENMPKGEFVTKTITDSNGKTRTETRWESPLLWVAYEGEKTGTTKWIPATDRSAGRWRGCTPGQLPDAFIVLPDHPKAGG